MYSFFISLQVPNYAGTTFRLVEGLLDLLGVYQFTKPVVIKLLDPNPRLFLILIRHFTLQSF